MKFLHLKFSEVLCFLQIYKSIVCIWPQEFEVGKLVFGLRKIYYNYSIFNIIFQQIALIYTIYQYQHDVTIIMKALSEFACLTEVLINLFICRLKSVHIQQAMTKIKNFFVTSKNHEKIILQKYIDRYAFFCLSIPTCYVLTMIAFCCTPMFTSKKFPSEGSFPFSTESLLVTCIIYTIQVYTIIQCMFYISVNFLFVLFFLYSTARLEMLHLEMQTIKNERHINSCIKKHQEIIKFVDESRDIVKLSLFVTNIILAICAICSTFPIIYKQTLEIPQFIFLVIAGCQRLFITAWTADDLMENSTQLAVGIYYTPWNKNSQHIIKKLCFVIQRSQRPLVINMGRLFPILSLKFYAKYLFTLLTYFTTTRAIINNLNH